jgi:hypothetical protein
VIKKIGIFLSIFSFFVQLTFAQDEKDSLVMNLHLKFDKQDFALNKKYISAKNDSLQIDLFKFYISSVSVQFSDGSIFTEQNSYHLIDSENPKSLQIPLCKNEKSSIKKVIFNLGIDSLASTSGALGGDLDPTKGMYWAWQSGYINFKMEGKSSSCITRKNEFQFHIGGYLKPNYAMRKIVLEPNNPKSTIDINVDLAAIFLEIALSKKNSIMIPGKQAMEIADFSVKMFTVE